MLIADVPEFTCPINSWIIFGGSPAAGMTVGAEMIRAISKNYMESRLRAIEFIQFAGKNRHRPVDMISSRQSYAAKTIV
jgi:hypothetical protein